MELNKIIQFLNTVLTNIIGTKKDVNFKKKFHVNLFIEDIVKSREKNKCYIKCTYIFIFIYSFFFPILFVFT